MTSLDTLEFDPTPHERLLERNGRALDSKVGFEIGWDIAAYGLRPPVLPNDAFLSGYEEACTRRAAKTLEHDRYVRKWLQLRVGAWLRHRVVDEGVTPAYLRTIDAVHCPVMGCLLTYSTGNCTDWSVDRINNEGAYAPGNLAVISSQANLAKGRKSYTDVVALAATEGLTSGLAGVHWARMAALMVVPCHVAVMKFPTLPYPLHPPKGVPLSFDQTLQWVLVNQCHGGPRTVIGRLKAACNTPLRQRSFHQLVQKVRRKSERLADWPAVWLNASLWAVFQEFLRTMDLAEFGRLKGVLCFKDHAWDPAKLEAWQLDCRGYSPGYNPPNEQTISAGLVRSCDEAVYDEVSRGLDELLGYA